MRIWALLAISLDWPQFGASDTGPDKLVLNPGLKSPSATTAKTRHVTILMNRYPADASDHP